jgi:hypothetical protein
LIFGFCPLVSTIILSSKQYHSHHIAELFETAEAATAECAQTKVMILYRRDRINTQHWMTISTYPIVDRMSLFGISKPVRIITIDKCSSGHRRDYLDNMATGNQLAMDFLRS